MRSFNLYLFYVSFVCSLARSMMVAPGPGFAECASAYSLVNGWEKNDERASNKNAQHIWPALILFVFLKKNKALSDFFLSFFLRIFNYSCPTLCRTVVDIPMNINITGIGFPLLKRKPRKSMHTKELCAEHAKTNVSFDLSSKLIC